MIEKNCRVVFESSRLVNPSRGRHYFDAAVVFNPFIAEPRKVVHAKTTRKKFDE